jgi:DNA-binding LacI/PurR family transcriptional regulator
MKKKPGPKTVRRDALTDLIRDGIVSGKWRPGERLPARAYFQERYGSANLVNSAFQTLFDEGILEACEARKKGTHVHPRPPFLHRYAVLLNHTADDMDFHTRAVYEAAQILKGRGKQIEIHFDLNREFDDPEHLRLHQRILRHEFAGVYRETLPQRKQVGELRNQTTVPVVGALNVKSDLPNFASFASASNYRLEKRALRFLKQAGANDIAVVKASENYEPESERKLRTLVREAGLNCPQRYYVDVSLHSFSLVIPALKALLSSENERFPDGMLLVNDNFLPYAMQVFEACSQNQKVRDLQVVVIGNYPNLPEFSHPLRYFSYDHLAMMESGFRFIDAFRRGETVSRELPTLYYEGEKTC